MIHKNGKRYEPYTNKEIEDSLVKMHTKKQHKKQAAQSLSQHTNKSKSKNGDGFDRAFEEEMKFAAELKTKEDAKEAKVAEKKKAEKDKEARFKKVQPDGLVHKDGKRIDPETGVAVDEN